MKLEKEILKFNLELVNLLINQGLNNNEIGKVLDIDSRRIGELLKHFNIHNANARYLKKINHNYFDIIDTEAKAYILGFIIGDGCINIEPKKRNSKIYSYTKRLSFCQSIDDFEIINKIKYEISPEANIKYLNNTKEALNRKPQVFLRINSKILIDKLIEYNIKPNKTKDIDFTFKWDIIPEQYKHHFIRGLIDSDGWLSINQSKYLILGFISTSLNFTKQLGDEISKNLNLKYNIVENKNKNMITYSLSFYIGKDFNIVKEYLYKDATIFLNRKFQKLTTTIPC